MKRALRWIAPAMLLVAATASNAVAVEPCDPLLVAATPGRPCGPQPAQNSWVFRRSYYTHDPAMPVQIGQNYSGRGPVYTRPQGEYVRGAYRNNYSVIQVNGQIWDRTWQWESWVQHGSQR